jgi:hypothetical protein
LLLHAVAAPDQSADGLADRPLGERNAALLRLRKTLFGDALNACVECPECGEKLEFSLSVDAMLSQPGPRLGNDAWVMVDGERLRLPTTRDLASVADEPDEARAVRKLLERLRADGAPGEFAITHDVVARALDAADPCMDFALKLDCPACSHSWDAALDVPGFLWQELEVRVRRLLDEVHVLASSYGWSESAILRLSEVRRAFYLQRVLA